MGEIFVSHASADDALVREIVERLRHDGYRSLFLDFDPEVGIAAGRPWLHELYRMLSQCRALVAVCTASWLQSQWCFAEFTYARALGKAVFVLKADACRLPAFAAEVQAVDLGGDPEAGHRALLRGLTEAGVDPVGAGATLAKGRPPYPGFNAFEAADEAVYFGRDAEVAETLQTLRTAQEFGTQPGAPRIVLVLGASGSGKSSLVRAGVLPVLGRDPGRWLVLPVVRPGTAPLDALADALEKAATPATSGQPSTRDRLHRADSAEPILARVLYELADGPGRERATPVLVVDQFEEVLGPRGSGQAEAFLSALRGAVLARPRPPIIIATLRSDALADFQEHPLLGDLRTVDSKLAPLTPGQLAAVMVQPAERAGLRFPPELVSRVLAELETADALPILAFTLREMYDRRADRFAITERDYREVGGIHGAVEQRLGGILRFQALTPAAEARLRDFFLTLVRVTPDGKRIRRQAAWADVPPDLRTTVEQLVDARLLVDRGAREHRTLDVVHESVFRVWPTLDRWIADNEEFLGWRERLQNSVEEWKLLGRVEGALLPDEALPAAEQWRAKRADALSEEQAAFIQASRARRDRRLAEESARQAREIERERALREAEHQARIEAERSAALQAEAAAKLQAAADEAQARLADSYWIAGVRARERQRLAEAAHWIARAAEQERNPVRRTDARLAVADLTGAPRLAVLTDGFEALRGLAEGVSPALAPRALLIHDGRMIVSWLPGDDTLQGRGMARLWDVDSQEQIGADMTHEGWILGLRVSLTERTILTWGGLAVEASSVQLWSATSGQRLAAPMTHGATVTGAVFDRAESLILSHGEDGTARVWDIATGAPICRIDHEYKVVHAAFVDGERAVLSVEANGRAWLSPLSEVRDGRIAARTMLSDAEWANFVPVQGWHDGTLQLRLDSPMEHPDSEVYAALGGKLGDRVRSRGVLSPRGDRALTWDDGADVWLVGVRDEVVIPLEFVANARVGGGCFSGDGSRVLAWSSRGRGQTVVARVWDAATGAAMHATLEQGVSIEPSLSPTGRWVVTWPDHSSLEISDSRTGLVAVRSLVHGPKLKGFEFTDDERGLLTWASDGTARLWNVTGGSPRTEPIPHPGQLYEARLGPAAATLLTCCDDGAVRIWRLDDPRRQRCDVPGAVTSVTFAGDGARALLCHVRDRDQVTIRLWDLDRGEPTAPLMAHGPGADSTSIVGRPTGQAVFDQTETRVLSWSKDCTARLWDLRTGVPLAPPMQHHAQLWGARFFAADTRILTWSHDGTARLWHQDGRALGSVLKHGKSVEGAVLDTAGDRVLTWSADGTARLWDTHTGQPTIPALRHDDGVTGGRLSPDETEVLTWSQDGSVRLWSAADGRALVPPMRHSEAVAGACFDDTATRILSWTQFFSAWGRQAGAARVWDARDGRPLVDSLPHKAGVVGAVFFAAGTRILTWSKDNSARISDAASGQPVGEPLLHRGEVVGAHLSRDESLVLTWSKDHTARLWSTRDGTPAALPMRHDGPITGAAFSTDQERIVTYGKDGTVRLWRARDATLILNPLRMAGPVTGARFCLDDSAILSWSDDWETGEAVLWRFTVEPPLIDDLGLLVEIATGTAMDPHGNVTFLSHAQWRGRRRRL